MNALSLPIGSPPSIELDLALGGVSRPIVAEPHERTFETLARPRPNPALVSARRMRTFESVRR